VIEDDLPPVGAFAPHEREDAVVLLGFAVRGAIEVELAGNEGDL
jgi:hypothetical protein